MNEELEQTITPPPDPDKGQLFPPSNLEKLTNIQTHLEEEYLKREKAVATAVENLRVARILLDQVGELIIVERGQVDGDTGEVQ